MNSLSFVGFSTKLHTEICSGIHQIMIIEHIYVCFLVFIYSQQSVSSISAYWNIPTEICIKGHVDLNLSNYRIRANAHEKFYGDEVATFYESNFGLYPYFKNTSDSKSAINKGLPQLVDLNAHLRKAENDIIKAIPNTNFSGLAILDFEAWRPKYVLNWSAKRIYRNESEKIVRDRGSSLSNADVKKIAEKEFDEAAYKFMVETIKLGKKLRPNGKWGFYGFPLCNYDAGKNNTDECSNEFKKYNDLLVKILNEVDALYPSIYIKGNNSAEVNKRYVKAILTESKRLASKLNDPKKPIYAYSSFEYTYTVADKPAFYSKVQQTRDQDSALNSWHICGPMNEDDLSNTLKQMKDMDISGTIVWVSSAKMMSKCKLIKSYLDGTYGPYLLDLMK